MSPDRWRRLVPGLIHQDWVEHGSCVGSDVSVFFPVRGQNSTTAKAICAGCPVRQECLEYALESGETHGTWGGHTRDELKRIRAARRRGAA